MTGTTWNELPPSERQAIVEHAFKTSIYYGTWTWEQLPESIRKDLESISVYVHKQDGKA